METTIVVIPKGHSRYFLSLSLSLLCLLSSCLFATCADCSRVSRAVLLLPIP